MRSYIFQLCDITSEVFLSKISYQATNLGQCQRQTIQTWTRSHLHDDTCMPSLGRVSLCALSPQLSVLFCHNAIKIKSMSFQLFQNTLKLIKVSKFQRFLCQFLTLFQTSNCTFDLGPTINHDNFYSFPVPASNSNNHKENHARVTAGVPPLYLTSGASCRLFWPLVTLSCSCNFTENSNL